MIESLDNLPSFLVYAPGYSHRSAGHRALYRLCHLLNAAGYRAAISPWVNCPPARDYDTNPDWNVPMYLGPAGSSIVIYPETARGNPLGAKRVVRWTLNYPGLLGGDSFFPDEEMVFVSAEITLPVVNRSVRTPLGEERVLNIPLIDPSCIYPDPQVAKVVDCVFTYKGRSMRERFPLPNEKDLLRVEDHSSTMRALGDLLRRTRTLYSYDHQSFVLKEALICGCKVRVVHEGGELLDPRACSCALNLDWSDSALETYAQDFDDPRFVRPLIEQVTKRWPDALSICEPSDSQSRRGNFHA